MKKHLLFIPIIFFCNILICYPQTITLWGVTATGGGNVNSNGIIYETKPTGGTNDRYNFASNTIDGGINPTGKLIVAGNGLLYGMTGGGGGKVDAYGTLFSFNRKADTISYLVHFTGPNGMDPLGSLVQASDSLLYGMASGGGYLNGGTIFSYNIPLDTMIIIYNFDDDTNGGWPNGSLIQASDSLLYGMTTLGGDYGLGEIFSYNITTATFTKLYDFGKDTDGAKPVASFFQASNGLLYGTTTQGGSIGGGTIFSYNINTHIETHLYTFGNGTDGSEPYCTLVQDGDSLLYGLTQAGGTQQSGTIFSYNIYTGKEVDLHNFGIGNDGFWPTGSLVLASNGLLYGGVPNGGNINAGILFNYNVSDSVYKVIYAFPKYGAEGFGPLGNLLEVDSGIATNTDKLSPDNNQFLIYPNPTYGQFTLKLTDKQNTGTLEIFNVLGDKIYQSILSNDYKNSIDMSSQPAGLYFIYLKSETNVEVEKLILSK